MMHHRSMTLLAVPGVLIMLLTGCARDRDIAGATTETTNGIAGSIKNRDDTPAPNTIVRLFPDDYDPVSNGVLDGGFIDTTDAGGTFSFRCITPGRYAVLARNSTTTTSILIKDISVNDDSITTIPPVNLGTSGSLSAGFSAGDSIAPGSYVYIPGTDIFSLVESDGSVFLGDIPSGMVPAVMLTAAGGEKRSVLRNEVMIVPDDTVTIENPLWKYARRINFNTTPTGAGVIGDVYDFPVLIRLNAGNFDFTQARNDGGDLLFTGSGNVVLPCEIERWDAVGNHAEVWVKIATVFGNDSDQSITIYWGNPAAPPRSERGVFDTADGFQGVWHLGDAADDPVRDATTNRYYGISPDTARPSIAEGMIGNCLAFNGVTDYITMPNTADGKLNFPQDAHYTVCAWVFLDAFDNAPHLIVAKGYEQYYLRLTYFPSNSPLWEFVEFNETTDWQASTSPATSRQWTLLTGVRQGSRQFLYCNGVLVDSTVDVWPNVLSRNTSNDLSIGKFSKAVTVPTNDGYCFFKGLIDEVRIMSAAQSPDWVRLCYMNQRIDDQLVVFK